MYIKKWYELTTWIIADTWIIKNTNYINNPIWNDTISWSLYLYKDLVSFEQWKSELCSAQFNYTITNTELVQNLIVILTNKLTASVLDNNKIETNLLTIIEDNSIDNKIWFQQAQII